MRLPNFELHKRDEHHQSKKLHLLDHLAYCEEDLTCWRQDRSGGSCFLMLETGTCKAHVKSCTRVKDRDRWARLGPAQLWPLSCVGQITQVARCHPRAQNDLGTAVCGSLLLSFTCCMKPTQQNDAVMCLSYFYSHWLAVPSALSLCMKVVRFQPRWRIHLYPTG